MNSFALSLIMAFSSLVAASGGPSSGTQPALSCSDRLPAAIGACITKDFPGQSIFSFEDLLAEDQGLWRQLHPEACPGVAVGHFLSHSRKAFAVLLFERTGEKRYETLVVFEGASSCRRQIVWSRELVFSPVYFLDRLPPGRYESEESGEAFQSKLDVLSFSHLESESVLYFWRGNKFHFISDY
jgi:hypothetical protein